MQTSFLCSATTSVLALFLGATANVAHADINVGVILSTTDPAAALGIPERNTVALLPESIAGEKVNYIVLDDATDAASAGRNARKLVAESRVDVLIGSSNTPSGVAVAEVANESQTPQITLSPVGVAPDKERWLFRAPQHNDIMADGLIEHMKAIGVKTLGFIGYTDTYGESWLNAIKTGTARAGIQLTEVQRFNRTDTSATGQGAQAAGSQAGCGIDRGLRHTVGDAAKCLAGARLSWTNLPDPRHGHTGVHARGRQVGGRHGAAGRAGGGGGSIAGQSSVQKTRAGLRSSL